VKQTFGKVDWIYLKLSDCRFAKKSIYLEVVRHAYTYTVYTAVHKFGNRTFSFLLSSFGC